MGVRGIDLAHDRYGRGGAIVNEVTNIRVP
jgi:hypothetical protein